MNKQPQLNHEPKVIIKDHEAPARIRRSAEEVTIINRPIPVAIRPKGTNTGAVVLATVSAIALAAGAIVYNVRAKSPDDQSIGHKSIPAAISATPITNPATHAPSAEIPDTSSTVALNSIPTATPSTEASANSYEENPEDSVPQDAASSAPIQRRPVSNIPVNKKGPLPRKGEIIRELPF